VQGGVVQGIAQALLEEVVYDDQGQPLTSTLVDYCVPSAVDMPDMETHHLEIRTTGNSLGAKGLGEAGATAAPQAVVNAVIDAVGHLGIRTLDMPLTNLKLWRALNPDLQETS
jgi:carbon-monoxide dehydrogenase large subunit